ncbi:MAG: Exodeoxyribonuclease [Deltaproteobacteria bacterium]|jgi:endonuclease/exonuclease/phosphatase family metal-dependent hydrolase|nr:Exodeoxyribonuclease [Deltaproteobacteria bacterium]
MLTLVSWNIQYGKGVDGQIDLSRISQTVHKDGLPDILCLQEVSRNYPSTDDGADQVQQLQKLFPDYESYYGAVHDRSVGKGKGRKQFGNLILTRISPAQVLHHLLPSPADSKVKCMARQVTEMVITTSSGNFRVMNTHLEYFSEKQQLAQVRRIREIHEEASAQYRNPGIDLPSTPFEIVTRPESMIICGDFNFTPNSNAYQKMTAKFEDENLDLVNAWTALYPDKLHPTTCGVFDHNQWKKGPHCRDYFFISQNMTQQIHLLSVNAESNASDHQPIRLVLNV